MQAKKEYKATRSSNPYVLAAMAELASHGGGNLKRNSLPRDGQSMPADITNEDPDEISSNDDSGDDLDDFIVCKPGATTGRSLRGSSSTAAQSPDPS